MKRALFAAYITVFLTLTGCYAHYGPYGEPYYYTEPPPGLGILGGAAAGAAIGANVGRDPVAGAVVGGAIGAITGGVIEEGIRQRNYARNPYYAPPPPPPAPYYPQRTPAPYYPQGYYGPPTGW